MTNLDINEVNKILDQRIKEIFFDKDLNLLTNYEKRKIIFDYVCQKGKYNFKLLNDISNNKASRNLISELYAALNEEESICNGFAGYYKLLLDRLNIYSVCICCNDGTNVPHQLNLVKNDDGTYSFDDVTSGIVRKENKDDYFDYDQEDANRLGQGKKYIEDTDKYYIIISIIYDYLGIDITQYLKHGIESKDGFSYSLPQISSYRKRTNIISK